MNMKYVFSLLLLAPLLVPAQKKCSITISFEDGVDRNRISIMLYNGLKRVKVPLDPDSSKVVITDVYYSIYAIVEVAYPQITGGEITDDYASFYIDKETSSITFVRGDSSAKLNEKAKVVNAIKANDLGRNQWAQYVRKEHTALVEIFRDLQTGRIIYSDSVARLIAERDKQERLKTLDYITHNGDLYDSFWSFCSSFLNSELIGIDSLLKIYSATFPSRFRDSYEGQAALKTLYNRKMREEQRVAPDFSVADFTGNTIKLSDFKNKYVLINFWGSYCAPCVKEFPMLTKMISELPVEEVAVIFVNTDESYEAFARAREKYNLIGIHVKATDELIKNYKAESIPQVYLIDKNGKIVYDRDKLEDYELLRLQDMLHQTFKLPLQ
jgi:thiol-disulfide isomerase/thioredoxin